MPIDKRADAFRLAATANAKVTAMTQSEKEARVQQIYSTPSGELTAADNAEFFAIMFGGASTPSNGAS